jgi:hypothetical protein
MLAAAGKARWPCVSSGHGDMGNGGDTSRVFAFASLGSLPDLNQSVSDERFKRVIGTSHRRHSCHFNARQDFLSFAYLFRVRERIAESKKSTDGIVIFDAVKLPSLYNLKCEAFGLLRRDALLASEI